MKRSYRLFSSSAEETLTIGASMGRHLYPGMILALIGDLGAGKTQFIKGVVSGALHLLPENVSSPTFCYLNSYAQGSCCLHHFDLYRLKEPQAFVDMGFTDYLSDPQNICCIEWPEIISSILPPSTITIELTHQGSMQRTIDIELEFNHIHPILEQFLKT